MKILQGFAAFLVLQAAGAAVLPAAGLGVAVLRCEQDVNPIGVDVPQPQLGWVLQSTGRSETHTAYRVLVASTPELLARDQGDLWDSGRVASGDTVGVAYNGRPLQSSRQVFWKVRAWDRMLRATSWTLRPRPCIA